MMEQDLEQLRKDPSGKRVTGPRVVGGSLLALRSIKVEHVPPEALQHVPNRFPLADR